MQDKDSLRRELLARRDSIPPVVRRSKDRAIYELLVSLDEFRAATTILFFASFRSEVDTLDMIKTSLAQGKKAVLPRVVRDSRSLSLFEIRDLSELSEGYMGIPEPAVGEERSVPLTDVDLVVIPGAGFDASGNRIGYGGGYYDRMLAEAAGTIPVVAPAYEEQFVESVPSEPHDRKVGIIVTDRRVIRFS